MVEPQAHESGTVAVQTAKEALVDVLVNYNVPSQQIVAEFLKLIADPAYKDAT